MAIGNTSGQTVASLNGQLGNAAITLRNACAQVIAVAGGANGIGNAGLVTLGFSSGDATQFITAANHMLTVAQVYYGLAAQASAFNFDQTADLIAARGGQ